jgi:hypothetical protein
MHKLAGFVAFQHIGALDKVFGSSFTTLERGNQIVIQNLEVPSREKN